MDSTYIWCHITFKETELCDIMRLNLRIRFEDQACPEAWGFMGSEFCRNIWTQIWVN